MCQIVMLHPGLALVGLVSSLRGGDSIALKKALQLVNNLSTVKKTALNLSNLTTSHFSLALVIKKRPTGGYGDVLFLDFEHERVFAWGCTLAEERHVDFDCAADSTP